MEIAIIVPLIPSWNHWKTDCGPSGYPQIQCVSNDSLHSGGQTEGDLENKFEYQNPKFETNPNDRNQNDQNR
jgi:hypothetical protein